MQIIYHYKGMIDIITSTANQYSTLLETNITERLIINDGIIYQTWNNLSLEELEIVNEMMANNNYTDYIPWMKMNKRNKKIDKLLNKNY